MKVLLVKMSSLGDVVHALPAVSDAVRAGHVIDWVVEEAFADVARMHAGVRDVIPIAWRRWRKSLAGSRREIADFWSLLREKEYDLVLDSQGLFKSAAVALAARGKRVGYARDSARESLSTLFLQERFHVPRGQHAIDRQRSLFAEALGYTVDADVEGGLEARETNPGQTLLLHGTTWPTKHWPVDMWVYLAREIHRSGAKAMLTWGNEAERQRAEEIAEQTGAEVLQRMPLRELADVIGESEVVIGVDSGLTHLAAALGVPTIGLYGPTDIVLTGCRGPKAKSLQSPLPCTPCVAPACTAYRGEPLKWGTLVVDPPCFAALTPQRVWAEAQELKGAV